jgi:hypothetical protein
MVTSRCTLMLLLMLLLLLPLLPGPACWTCMVNSVCNSVGTWKQGGSKDVE